MRLLRKLFVSSGQSICARSAGFTFIELTVVIALLGILVTIGATSYVNSLRTARNAKRQADLQILRNALEFYHADYACYPATANGSINSVLTPYLQPTYIKPENWPVDPQQQNHTLRYYYSPNVSSGCATSYNLCAHLEVKTPGPSPSPNCPSDPYCNSSTLKCNYGVTQPS